MESPLTPEQLKMLNTPLRPDEIEHKQGMSYLKGQLAVVKANRIFGTGNWSYKQIGPIEITDTGIKNSKGNTIFLVSATVELTVRGCETFVEQGDCEAQGMGAPAISMARKGAVTDGLKRCLKNFGAAFGLDLYFADGVPQEQPAQPQRQQASAQATSRPVTQNSPAPVKPIIQTQQAPRAVTLPPIGTPNMVAVDNDPNFIFYKAKILAAKNTLELSALGPEMRRQVVDQAVLKALGKEYTKREAAMVEKAEAEIARFVGTGAGSGK